MRCCDTCSPRLAALRPRASQSSAESGKCSFRDGTRPEKASSRGAHSRRAPSLSAESSALLGPDVDRSISTTAFPSYSGAWSGAGASARRHPLSSSSSAPRERSSGNAGWPCSRAGRRRTTSPMLSAHSRRGLSAGAPA
eukprot:3623660-Rhodomonas_salina.2